MSTMRGGDLEVSSTIVRAGRVDQVSSRVGSCIRLSKHRWSRCISKYRQNISDTMTIRHLDECAIYHGGASVKRSFSDVHAGVLSASAPPVPGANPTLLHRELEVAVPVDKFA